MAKGVEIVAAQHRDVLYAAWARLIEGKLKMKYVSDEQIDYMRGKWNAVFEGVVGISNTQFPFFYAQIREEMQDIRPAITVHPKRTRESTPEEIWSEDDPEK